MADKYRILVNSNDEIYEIVPHDSSITKTPSEEEEDIDIIVMTLEKAIHYLSLPDINVDTQPIYDYADENGIIINNEG
jgi:hypothetical protein